MSARLAWCVGQPSAPLKGTCLSHRGLQAGPLTVTCYSAWHVRKNRWWERHPPLSQMAPSAGRRKSEDLWWWDVGPGGHCPWA